MSRDDFWSRRKAQVEAEEAALQQEDAERARETDAAEKTDDEILAELDLPDPDTLGEGDDFSGFMNGVVPTRLRNRALRRLWLTNPVLANVDGLVEYGEDYTDAATVVENLQTAYQVGKGMTKHVLEMLRQDEEDAEKETESDPVDEPPEDAPELAEIPPEDPIAQDNASFSQETPEKSASLSQDNYGKPRRMRYSFENAPGEDA